VTSPGPDSGGWKSSATFDQPTVADSSCGIPARHRAWQRDDETQSEKIRTPDAPRRVGGAWLCNTGADQGPSFDELKSTLANPEWLNDPDGKATIVAMDCLRAGNGKS
jgi:hypothetical protein